MLDQGNLYLIYNVFSNPRASYAAPDARELLALSGRDGHTLWQTEIPWNSHHLAYAEVELPVLTVGAGVSIGGLARRHLLLSTAADGGDGRLFGAQWDPAVEYPIG